MESQTTQRPTPSDLPTDASSSSATTQSLPGLLVRQPDYKPVVLGTRQSRYGYWIVTISAAPGFRVEVMCAILGITSKDAESMIIGAASQLPHVRIRQ